MRFWDSSALVALLLEQPRSAHARALIAEDGEMMVWWGSAIECAMRVLRVHPLRAADALQLAAALEWSGGGASGTFITYDECLRDAASREGFDAP